jgi:anti-anti-sigma factor
VRAGQDAVLADGQQGVRTVPVLHDLEPAEDLPAHVGAVQVVAGEHGGNRTPRLFEVLVARGGTSPHGLAFTWAMQPEFQISHRTEGGWTVVQVHGEADVSTVPQVREHTVELIEGGHRHLILDLRGVTFMDSTGLGVLVGILKRIRACHGDLKLVIANPDIVRIFTITGLHKVFPIYDSVDIAVTEF